MVCVVKRYPEEPFEKLFKRFRKLVEQEQIVSTYMRKRYYQKPSEKRRYKAKKSEIRRRKAELKRLKKLGLLKKNKKSE
jgi:small subunit ribosomal protein S21